MLHTRLGWHSNDRHSRSGCRFFWHTEKDQRRRGNLFKKLPVQVLIVAPICVDSARNPEKKKAGNRLVIQIVVKYPFPFVLQIIITIILFLTEEENDH